MNIEAIMKPLREFLSKMTKGQKIRFAILGVVLIALVIIAVVLMSRTEYAVLYSGMDAAEAGEVYNILKNDKQVDAQIEGTTIRVPAKQRDSILADLAASGIPKSGMAYDLMNNASGMGSTDAEKEVWRNYQLQENLGRTIKQMDAIGDARVFLYIPKSSNMIKSEIKKSTASIMVDVKGDEQLPTKVVKSISHLVASSSGIDPADITISDQKGNYYNTDTENGLEAASDQHNLEHKTRERFQEYVRELMNPVYGEGNVVPIVNVKMSFDERLEQSVTFSPPEGSEELAGLRISRQEDREGNSVGENAEGNPGMDSNGGAVPEYQENTGDGVNDYYRTSIETNWELNQLKEEIKAAKGQITDLQVGVLINGGLDMDDYTQDWPALIARGLGIDEEYIQVSTIPFYDNSEEIEAAKAEYDAQLRSVQMQKLIRTIVIVVGILAALFLIIKLIRDISNNALEAKRAQAEAVNKFSEAATGGGEGAAASIETDKKSSERQQIEEFIDKSPEAVAQLLRNWIAEDMR